jgi:hypothetical protein
MGEFISEEYFRKFVTFMRWIHYGVILFIIFSHLVWPTTVVHVVSWDQLRALNYETGDMPESLKQLAGIPIQIEGFMVPLELGPDISSVTTFILVPDPLACLHVPPPPPNQMIYVEMSQDVSLDMDARGIRVTGTLHIPEPTAAYGGFSFSIDGQTAEAVDIEYDDPWELYPFME